jgi:predicted dehydrogenase
VGIFADALVGGVAWRYATGYIADVSPINGLLFKKKMGNSMAKVRVALVGAGKRGSYLASLFHSHPDCTLVGVMDTHLASAEKAIKSLNAVDAKAYANFDKLLSESGADALLITTNPMQQVELACRAMEKGRHVCTEVPAAFTLKECWDLVRTVEKTGCKYQLMEQTRYWGFIQHWRKMHQEKQLGHIAMAQGEYVHFESNWNYWVDPVTGEQFGTVSAPKGRTVVPTWRQICFANPIYYLPHTLSPLLSIVGGRVLRVSCMGTRAESYTFPGEGLMLRDIEYALMQTSNDTLLNVGAGFTLPHVSRGMLSAHWYELRGTAGSVTSPRYKGDSFREWKRGEASYEPRELSTIPLDANEGQAKSGHGGADFKPVDSFLRAIIDDTPPPLDVYLTAELTAPAVLAAESSRRNGEMIEVPDFRKKH